MSLNRREILQMLSITMLGSAITPFTSVAKTPETANKQDADHKPIHLRAGQGKIGKIGAGDIAFKFTKQQTSGHLGLTESVLPVGVLGAPPHFHKGFDEICGVTQGTLTIMVGKEIFEVKAGDWHLRPKNIVHSFWNKGTEPAKFIEIYTPGGHEAYMNELSDLFISNQRPKPGDLDKLANKYDITFDWPGLKVIMDTYGVHL